MTYWALKPITSASDISGTFNFSSATTFINLISVLYFIILTVFRSFLPEGKQSLFFIYSLVFFVLLSFFLDEDNIPSSEIKAQKRGSGKVFDFSDTKDDSEILSLG